MAPTLSKDRCLAIGIHRHLRTSRLRNLRKNFLKFDIIFQSARLQEHVLANRLPKPADILLCKAETQTVEHMTEVLNDPAFRQLITGAEKEFSLQSGACSFSADVLTRIDATSSHDQNDDALSHLICIFKIPPHLTTDEFQPKFKKWIDGFASLPVTKKVVVKHTEVRKRPFGFKSLNTPLMIVYMILFQWVQNKTLDPQLGRWVTLRLIPLLLSILKPGLLDDPLGDIDLQREFRVSGVVDHRPELGHVRRVYSAKVKGQNSNTTVAMYQGHGAEERWRQDIVKYISIRHPNMIQICGAASSGAIHAALFHSDLIPFQHFVELHRESPILTVYLYASCQAEFRAAQDYFRSVFQQPLWEPDCTFLVHRRSGRLCVDLAPGDLVEFDYNGHEMSDPARIFHAHEARPITSLISANNENIANDSLTLENTMGYALGIHPAGKPSSFPLG
ncbi:hypothetical protein B0H13DRAFT_2339429 [Mycena leptocephala]|nr:hypothetical protein B0H13DRAFT_2339429 [Mycena leptocephala]